MDSPRNSEQMPANLDKNGTSATGDASESPGEKAKAGMKDSIKQGSHADTDSSPSSAQDDTTQSQNQMVHSCDSSPEHQANTQLLHKNFLANQQNSELQQERLSEQNSELHQEQVDNPQNINPRQDHLTDFQQNTELRQEHLFNSNSGSDVFGSGDPDLEQLYRLSAHRFSGPGSGPDSHYDDLPLSFSFPYSEDESSKVYSCNICNFKTAFKNSLVNHQAVHSDARPWICDICDYAAKRKQDLKKHLQTMHGMIVDSLALKPGANPPASSASSSGLASPIDTKPVIVNNVVVSEDQYGSMHAATSVPQQHMAGFSQTNVDQNPRSMPMPAVGKFISNKFPFNQFYGESATPRFSSEAFVNQAQLGLRGEREVPGLDSLPGPRFQAHDERPVSKQPNMHRFHRKDSAHNDDGSSKQLPSVSEIMLSKDRHHRGSYSGERVIARSPEAGRRIVDLVSKDIESRSAGHSNSLARISSISEELGHRRKRTSGDNAGEGGTSDIAPSKAARFRSPSQDTERSQHISSQSDHISHTEPISSTVSLSRSMESRKSFHCTHCDIVFFENALYLMHMGLHDNSDPWKCRLCGRTFFEKYSFTSHFINQH